MRRTGAFAGLALAAAVALIGCAPPGEGSGVQEDAAPPSDETADDTANQGGLNIPCFVGEWSLDVQGYAEAAAEAQMSTFPIHTPVGTGERLLVLYENGQADLYDFDFTVQYTIEVPEFTLTFNETWNGGPSVADWGSDGTVDGAISFSRWSDGSQHSIFTSEGVEVPVGVGGSEPLPSDTPIPAECEADVLEIDGPVPSIWYRTGEAE